MHTFAKKPGVRQPAASAGSTILGQTRVGQRHEVNAIHRAPRADAPQRQTEANTAASKAETTAPSLDWNFGRIPVHAATSARLQTRLELGMPGDAYEQEADRIAEQVMRMPEPKGRSKAPADISGDAITPAVQTKSTHAGDSGGIAAPPIVHDVLRSPGQPLDATARAFMEPRFGQDFSRVRVHTDARAADSAAAIGARAYTVGHDVAFGRGRYDPAHTEGSHLLAHELTHVVQQRSGNSAVMRLTEKKPDDHADAQEPAEGTVPQDVIDHLKLREGWREDVYKDTKGLLTVGMGHLLTEDEKALYKLGDKVSIATLEAWAQENAKDAYDAAVTQASTLRVSDKDFIKALTSVNFQLGTAWSGVYKKTWAFMVAHEWEKAAVEAQDSKWYTDTPVRVTDFQAALRALNKVAAPTAAVDTTAVADTAITNAATDTTAVAAADTGTTNAITDATAVAASETAITMAALDTAVVTTDVAPAVSPATSYEFKIGKAIRQGWVTASSLIIRNGPGKIYTETGAALKKGVAVTIYGEVDGWNCIGSGQWVSGNYISGKAPATVEKPATTPVKPATPVKTVAPKSAADKAANSLTGKETSALGISFGPNTNRSDVSGYSLAILKKIMNAAKVSTVTISSTVRGPFDQARVMYDNLEGQGKGQGTKAQKKLYGSYGDAVIDVYVAAKEAKNDRDAIIALMEAKIIELGPTKVSHHAAGNLKELNAFDVGPNSIPSAKKAAWEAAIKASTDLSKFIFPPDDPGYHLEIKQPQAPATGKTPATTPVKPATAVKPKQAPGLDLKPIARNVWDAMFGGTGIGTDEEKVYANLAKLDHDKALIAGFEKLYRAMFGTDVVADIRSDFTDSWLLGDELTRALSYLAVSKTAPQKTATPKPGATDAKVGSTKKEKKSTTKTAEKVAKIDKVTTLNKITQADAIKVIEDLQAERNYKYADNHLKKHPEHKGKLWKGAYEFNTGGWCGSGASRLFAKLTGLSVSGNGNQWDERMRGLIDAGKIPYRIETDPDYENLPTGSLMVWNVGDYGHVCLVVEGRWYSDFWSKPKHQMRANPDVTFVPTN
jgi:GH24 family phage-related lysozyme (muramidase)